MSIILGFVHEPSTASGSYGYRHLAQINCDSVRANHHPERDIKNYADHLYAKAGGAVLAWIMEGARLIHSENYHLAPPKQVVAASEAYRAANDWFAHFLEDCCQVGQGLSEQSKDLYDAYRSWAMGRVCALH